MEIKTIYQTLEDRDNPDQVENEGPFKCKGPNSWLGEGCYFWDAFVDNAHWWGKQAHNGNYMVCEGQFNFNDTTCFDLVGNTEHMQVFRDALVEMSEQGLIKSNTLAVKVIRFLIEFGFFKYPSIRVNPINSQSKDVSETFKVNFVTNNRAYLDYRPPIQICIYNLQEVKFKNYRVIYPDHYYQDDYIV